MIDFITSTEFYAWGLPVQKWLFNFAVNDIIIIMRAGPKFRITQLHTHKNTTQFPETQKSFFDALAKKIVSALWQTVGSTRGLDETLRPAVTTHSSICYYSERQKCTRTASSRQQPPLESDKDDPT